ncbi:MAG: FMN-binding negative transcriptional regulator [Acidobacteriota bacterium]|nr:FMN-binding negative transcriptional regulator [Acidobacteriota bacterium]
MYNPPAFAQDADASWGIVERAGAALLVGSTASGLSSAMVPVVVEDRRRLLAHVARANRWWREVPEASEVLALFLVADAYVSPRYYPSTLEQPAAVPTWNYVMAEVRGTLRVHDDPAWIESQARALVERFEADADPRWWVDEAPRDYLETMVRAIVGIEIEVTSIEGKAKLSQNREARDAAGVRAALAQGSLIERALAQEMDG